MTALKCGVQSVSNTCVKILAANATYRQLLCNDKPLLIQAEKITSAILITHICQVVYQVILIILLSIQIYYNKNSP